MDALDLFYWDSCLFYEHLKGENVSLLGLGGHDGKVCGVYPLKIISPSTAQGNLDV